MQEIVGEIEQAQHVTWRHISVVFGCIWYELTAVYECGVFSHVGLPTNIDVADVM